LERFLLGAWLFAPSTALAAGAERTASKVTVPGEPAIQVFVTRQRHDDGGVTVRLIASGVAERPQALTLYAGGGDDDSPGDAALKGVKAQPFQLPDGQRAVRVDLKFVIPGRTNDFQTDTTLIGFAGKPHKLAQLRTRVERDRSKVCREVKETQLRFSSDKPTKLEATTALGLEPALGDDDLPIDKGCRGKSPMGRVVYQLDREKFVQVDPPPSRSGDDGED
jgi:hypothetical protein